ncbi:MAG: hypothetical protein ACREUU_00450 [Gammaproteobacteria bacterium]
MMRWLYRLADEPILPFLVVEPRFAPLRGEAQYAALVRKAGL